MKIIRMLLASVMLGACSSNESKPIDVYQIQNSAMLAYQKKDWRTAHKYFQKLVEINPADSELWFKLGNIYARLNWPDRAIASYKEALVRKPEMSKAWHNIGVVSLRKSARLFIEMLKHISPDDPLYAQAKATGEALLKVLEDRRLSAKSVEKYPGPLENHEKQGSENDSAK